MYLSPGTARFTKTFAVCLPHVLLQHCGHWKQEGHKDNDQQKIHPLTCFILFLYTGPYTFLLWMSYLKSKRYQLKHLAMLHKLLMVIVHHKIVTPQTWTYTVIVIYKVHWAWPVSMKIVAWHHHCPGICLSSLLQIASKVVAAEKTERSACDPSSHKGDICSLTSLKSAGRHLCRSPLHTSARHKPQPN